MAFVADFVLDSALSVFTDDANRFDVTSQEAVSYAGATTTYTLGNKTGITVGSPADRSPDGRKITVSAITDGAITGTGTATHWALTDTANSRLLATGSLSSSQAVTSGNTFTTGAFDVGIPDAS